MLKELENIDVDSIRFYTRKIKEAKDAGDTAKECRAVRDLFEELAKLSQEGFRSGVLSVLNSL